MKIFILLSLFPLFLFSQLQSMSKSTITLPIDVNLTQLENYLNTAIPQVLSEIEERDKVCIKPQYLKTKGIPKCRIDNFKISCKERLIKIQTIPEIKCDIIGWVKRNGTLSVSGRGNTLRFVFPIKSKITTKSPIDGTATAAAILYIDAIPYIHSDWSITMDINATFTWSQKPTITLLNGIEITVQKRVENRLKKRLNTLLKKLPKQLSKLHLKKKISDTWYKIQDPIKLDKQTKTYLLFKPDTISYSGFRIVKNNLQTTLSINGHTHIIVGTLHKKIKKIKLSKLKSIPFQKGKFVFNLPISIPYLELVSRLNHKFKRGYTIHLEKNALPGRLTFTNPQIQKSAPGEIQISSHIHYDSNTTWLQNIEGEIVFRGTPKIDKKNQILILEKLTYSTKTNHKLFDSLINASKVKPLHTYLKHLMQFKYASHIQKEIQKANSALKSISKKNITLFAQLHMVSIDNLYIDKEKIVLYTKTSGLVQANLILEPK